MMETVSSSFRRQEGGDWRPHRDPSTSNPPVPGGGWCRGVIALSMDGFRGRPPGYRPDFFVFSKSGDIGRSSAPLSKQALFTTARSGASIFDPAAGVPPDLTRSRMQRISGALREVYECRRFRYTSFPAGSGACPGDDCGRFGYRLRSPGPAESLQYDPHRRKSPAKSRRRCAHLQSRAGCRSPLRRAGRCRGSKRPGAGSPDRPLHALRYRRRAGPPGGIGRSRGIPIP